jgi:hypothetical protein
LQQSEVKAYIRNSKTSLLYAGWHAWRCDSRKALSFQTIPAAQKTISHDHLKAAEIVLMESATGLQVVFSAARFCKPIPHGADEPEP